MMTSNCGVNLRAYKEYSDFFFFFFSLSPFTSRSLPVSYMAIPLNLPTSPQYVSPGDHDSRIKKDKESANLSASSSLQCDPQMMTSNKTAPVLDYQHDLYPDNLKSHVSR